MRPPPRDTVVGERYTLVRYLGAGAIGAVYQASTPEGEQLALKLLLVLQSSEQGEEVAARFAREAEVASKLKSEHIVPVLDWGRDDMLQTSYLVMPLLCGFDLEAALGRAGALHPTVAARLGVQACRGLTVAHQLDVVHRDVKPQNLFLDHGPNGEVTVRVLDFGLAKVIGSEMNLTSEDSVLGTPHYMAPEQVINAKDVDARADVWGLGATLYHALTGSSPFAEQRGFTDLCLAITTSAMPPVQQRAPWVDPALASLIEGALLRDRATRCPDIASLGRALEPFTAGDDALAAHMLVALDAKGREKRARQAAPTKRWQPRKPASAPAPPSPAQTDAWLGKSIAGHHLRRALGRPGSDLYEAHGESGGRKTVRLVGAAKGGTLPAPPLNERVARLRELDDHHLERVVALVRDDATGQRAVVSEALSGVDLAGLVRKHGPLDPQVATAIAWQACQGLVALHAAGLVHGALRPSRLLLHQHPDGEQTIELTGLCGAPAPATARGEDRWCFAAPEQAANDGATTEAADVFSLGGCLYYALTGAPPWPAALPTSALRETITRGRPRHLQDLAPWVRCELATVVHRSLEPDPTARWASAEALLQALEPLAHLRNLRRRDLAGVPRALETRVESRAAPIAGGETIELGAADGAGGVAAEVGGVAPQRAAASAQEGTDQSAGEATRTEEPSPHASRAPLLLLVLLLAAVGAYAAWQARGRTGGEGPAPATTPR